MSGPGSHLARSAMTAAAFMMAHQVAAKAARDGIGCRANQDWDASPGDERAGRASRRREKQRLGHL